MAMTMRREASAWPAYDEPSSSASRYHQCPACPSTTIERRQLTRLQHIVAFVLTRRRRYECCECGEQFRDWPV